MHTYFLADQCYNLDIHVEKIYAKNEDSQILDTFAQRPLKQFDY